MAYLSEKSENMSLLCVVPPQKPIFCGADQRCTESEIFDSDSAPASAEYTPTPKHFKVLDPDSCLNSKVNYLKAVAIDAPVDLEI